MGSIVGMAAILPLHQVTLFPRTNTGTSYWISFLVPTCFLVLALIIFYSARQLYVIRAPEGSLLTKVCQVIKSAWNRRNNPELSNFPFLMRADHFTFGTDLIVQVDQVFSVCTVFAFSPLYWLLYGQMSTNFIAQANHMELPSGMSPDQLNIADSIVIVVLVPVFDSVLPKIRKAFGWRLGLLASDL
jgi:POT family proton-dependent oligopeptide transporter